MANTTKKDTTPAKVPAGAKKPQDRQDKAARAEATGQPLSFEHGGVTYTVEQSAATDVELMEDIGEMQDGAYYLLPRVCRRMLGAEQYTAWKESVRNPTTGVVDAEDLGELFSTMDALLGNYAASSGS